jgi:hypothetical protein
VGWPNMSSLVTWKLGGGNINGGVGDCSRWFWWALFYSRVKVGEVHGSWARLGRKGRWKGRGRGWPIKKIKVCPLELGRER